MTLAHLHDDSPQTPLSKNTNPALRDFVADVRHPSRSCSGIKLNVVFRSLLLAADLLGPHMPSCL